MASSALLFPLPVQGCCGPKETQAQMPGLLSHKLLSWHSGCPSGPSKEVSYKATGGQLFCSLLRKWLGGLMGYGGCPLEWAVEDQGHRPFLF